MHIRWFAYGVVAVVGLTAAEAMAQGRTVQLPTYSFSGVGTTVMVPDQGSAYLGGINRASSGRNEFGVPMLDKLPFVGRPFGSRSIGQEGSASSFRVTATIHDFDAMEEALLGTTPDAFVAAARTRTMSSTPQAIAGPLPASRAPNLAGSWVPKSAEVAGGPIKDLAGEQADRAARQQVRADEAQGYLERGQEAEENGKRGAAKVFYQMAARRGSGEVKHQALARLEALGAGQTKVAQSQP